MTRDETIRVLCARTRALRLSTPDAAAMLEISSQHLYRIIRAERAPSEDLLLRWAAMCGGRLSIQYHIDWRARAPRGTEDGQENTLQTHQS